MTENPPETTRSALLRTATSKVTTLQRRVLANDAGAVAMLARLRRCDPAEVGAEPSVWQVTLGDLPDALVQVNGSRTEQPTYAEQALHAALVLYALHQQSKDEGVHHPGVLFGRAVGDLARRRAVDEELDSATVARLHQAALASTFEGHVHHLRGLIQLMRAEQPAIGLDYGLFAIDLWQLASPFSDSHRVVARWGRDLHHRPKKSDPTNEETK